MTNNPFIHNFLLSLPLKSYTLTKDNYNKSALWWEEHLLTGPHERANYLGPANYLSCSPPGIHLVKVKVWVGKMELVMV